MDRPSIVVLGFTTTYERNKQTGAMDRPVDWVEYSPRHAAMFTKVKDRVESMRPNLKPGEDQDSEKAKFFNHRWAHIESAYKAWKDGHEIPLNGTALGAWPGINAAQVQVFHAAGIKTVEDVATMTDGVLSRIALPNVRELREQAKAFLDARGDAQIADRLAQSDRERAQMREELDAALALLEQLKPKSKAEKKQQAEAA